jgi:hypothetical protein
MRKDEEQVPESELLDDSALEGISGGASALPGAVGNVAGVGRNLPGTSTPPPPPRAFEDG